MAVRGENFLAPGFARKCILRFNFAKLSVVYPCLLEPADNWTDNRHEFQVKFRWHLEDLGIRHTYINQVHYD